MSETQDLTAYKREWKRKQYWAKRNAGLCSNCDKPSAPGLTRCTECNSRHQSDERLRKYGIDGTAFRQMLEAQGNCCASCGDADPTGKGWHLDHDHDYAPNDPAGHRGILCSGCNLGIGHFYDDPERLEKAAAYLRKRTLV